MTPNKVNTLWAWAAGSAVGLALVAIGYMEYQNLKNEPELRSTPDIRINTTLDLSIRSKQDLQVFIDREDDIVIGASTIDVDFVKNVKRTTYFYTKNPALQDVWSTYLVKRTLLPVYSASAASQNERVTSLINGAMECQLFEESVNFKLWPDGAKYIKTICSVPVPPATDSSGDFVGFFNFFLSREPTTDEKKRLEQEALALSSAIYRRDFTSKK